MQIKQEKFAGGKQFFVFRSVFALNFAIGRVFDRRFSAVHGSSAGGNPGRCSGRQIVPNSFLSGISPGRR